MTKKVHQSRSLSTRGGRQLDLVGESVQCPVCHCQTGQEIYGLGDFSIVRCDTCSTLHLSPLPSPEGISEIYNNSYFLDDSEAHGYKDYSADEALIKKTYVKRFKKIQSCLPASCQLNRVHEIGAALGFGAEVAREVFVEADISCSDISREAMDACRRKGFESFVADNFARHERAAGSALDLLYFFDVVEHLYDLNPFLDWAHSVVRPKGYLALTTPDMAGFLNRTLGKNSPSIKIPQHIIYFTTETLCEAFGQHFQLMNFFVDTQYVSGKSLVSRLEHILNISLPNLQALANVSLLVPNGMKLYVFQKK